MSTLAEDIADVYMEIGSEMKILKTGSFVADSYIDMEQDMGSPYLRRAFLPSSTAAVPGSIVSIASVGATYLVLTKVPAVFENSPYEHECLFFMANFTGSAVRLSHTRNPVSYQQSVSETTVVASAYGFMSPGTVTLNIGKAGSIVINANDLYVPSSYNLQAGDRIKSGSEKWKVDSVRTRDYPGIAIANLAEDTR